MFKKTVFYQVLAFIFSLVLQTSNAHTPHDTIDALDIGGSDEDATEIFTVRGGWHLLRSINGGASWKELVNGLDTRYMYTSVAVVASLAAKSTVYVSSDGDGIYVSHDSGWSWKKCNNGLESLRIQSLVASPIAGNRHLVFALDKLGVLYRIDKEGNAWHRVFETNVEITTINFSGNGSAVYLGDSRGRLLQSIDDGATWNDLATIRDAGEIGVITSGQSSKYGDILLVATAKGGLYRSENSGQTFTKVAVGVDIGAIQSLEISPDFAQDSLVFATGWYDAIFKSDDAGISWHKFNQGLSTNKQADFPGFEAPYFSHIRVDQTGSAIYLAGFDGLFKSMDGGRSWIQLETETAGNIWSMSLSPAQNDDFVVAITTFNAGIYTTTHLDKLWSIDNYGLVSRRIRKLVFSPNFHQDQVVVSSEDEGSHFLFSHNQDRVWSRVELEQDWYTAWKKKLLGYARYKFGLSTQYYNELLSKAERAKANPKGLVMSPEFAEDQFLYISTRYRGNFESTDAGRTINRTNTPEMAAWDLVMSPEFPSDGTMFFSSREKGIYKSTDRGETWRSVNMGLGFLREWSNLAIEDDRMLVQLKRSKFFDIKLLISPGYHEDKTVFATGGEGVFKSVDGGETWFQAGANELDSHYILAAAISPNYGTDQSLLVSVKGQGLFVSRDGGTTFSAFADKLLQTNYDIRDIQFSPQYSNDHTIYAVSYEDLLRSRDNGETWELVERPIRYENNTLGAIRYRGTWKLKQDDFFSANSASYSQSSGNSVVFSFVGTGVEWLGERAPANGKARVFLDKKQVAIVDQSGKKIERSVEVFSVKNLAFGVHQLEIVQDVDAAGEEKGLVIDAFDVLGNRREQAASLRH